MCDMPRLGVGSESRLAGGGEEWREPHGSCGGRGGGGGGAHKHTSSTEQV